MPVPIRKFNIGKLVKKIEEANKDHSKNTLNLNDLAKKNPVAFDYATNMSRKK